MITVDVVCYKYKPLKNGELPLKIKVCKDRKTRYINLGVSTRQEFWDFENNRSIGINPDSLAGNILIIKPDFVFVRFFGKYLVGEIADKMKITHDEARQILENSKH